jgi:hypothetical protein
MRKSKYQSRMQFVLELERQNPQPPVVKDMKGLVEALADLLLGALGQQPAVKLTEKGGVDEPQDHA